MLMLTLFVGEVEVPGDGDSFGRDSGTVACLFLSRSTYSALKRMPHLSFRLLPIHAMLDHDQC